jgi:hypothetical protein
MSEPLPTTPGGFKAILGHEVRSDREGRRMTVPALTRAGARPLCIDLKTACARSPNCVVLKNVG